MKKLMTIMLGLTIALGSVTVSMAQDKSTKSTKKMKKSKAKKTSAPKGGAF
jgi:hypothetical protein